MDEERMDEITDQWIIPFSGREETPTYNQGNQGYPPESERIVLGEEVGKNEELRQVAITTSVLDPTYAGSSAERGR
jgi:hypothetical protein